MDEFVIEKNVPLPGYRHKPDKVVHKKKSRFAGLLEKMQVGDSVAFPDEKTKNSFCNYAKSQDVLVVSRKQQQQKGFEYRVWICEPFHHVRRSYGRV